MKSAAVSFAALSTSRSWKVGTELQAALSHAASYSRLTFLGRGVRAARRSEMKNGWPFGVGLGRAPDFGGIVADPVLELVGQRNVASWHTVVRGALEDGQVGGGFRDHRDGLDAGGAGADNSDALAAEIDAVMRPLPGVIPVPGKVLQTRECSARSPWTGSRRR